MRGSRSSSSAEVSMRVLLSIKPEYAEKILNGTKRFEYRKAVPRNESVRTVVIYATMPVGKVVGEFEVGGLREKPSMLWSRTKEASGITRAFFDSYISGRDEASAIAVRMPKRYAKPKNLEDVSGSSTPPQSFQYLAEAEV
jgi:predicted transcriptional regulator